MKKTLITFFTVLFCLTSYVGWSETWDDNIDSSISYKKFKNEISIGKRFFCKTDFRHIFQGDELSNGKDSIQIAYKFDIEINKLDHRKDNSQRIFNTRIDDHCFITNQLNKDYIWQKWGKSDASLNRCYFFKYEGMKGDYYGEILKCKERYHDNRIHNIKCTS